MRFSTYAEELQFLASQPNLDECPECGSPLVERDGEKICHTCGTRQPIITQQLAKTRTAFLPLLLGLGEMAGGAAAAEGAGAAAGAGAAGAGAAGAAGAGEGGGLLQMAQIGRLMNHAMGGQQASQVPQQTPAVTPGTPGALGTPGVSMSIAPPGTVGHVATQWGEDEAGGAVKNRGDNSLPNRAAETGIEGAAEIGDSVEQNKGSDEGGSRGPFSGDETDLQGGGWSISDTAQKAFHSNLPLVIEFAFSDQSGAEHPILKALDEMLEQAHPGYKDEDSFNQEGKDQSPTEKLEETLGQDLDDDDSGGGRPQEAKAVMAPVSHRKQAIPGTVGLGYTTPGVVPGSAAAPAPAQTTMMPSTGVERCAVCGQSHLPGMCPLADTTAPAAATPGMMGVPATHVITRAEKGAANPGEFLMFTPLVMAAVKWIRMLKGAGQPISIPGLVRYLQMEQKADPEEAQEAAEQALAQEQGPEQVSGLRTDTTMSGDDSAGSPDHNMKATAASTSEPDDQQRAPLRHSEDQAEEHDNRYEDGTPDTGWYEDWKGPGGEEDSPWVDDAEAPLEPGREYEMHSTQYAIPDRITVEHVSPDKITFLIHSGDVDYRDELTKDDVQNYGYSFQEPQTGETDSESGFGLEDANPPPSRARLNLTDPRPKPKAAVPSSSVDPLPQQDDLSAPPTRQGRTITDARGEEFEYTGSFKEDTPQTRDWLMEGSAVDVDPELMAKLAGKDFSPKEQRRFIDEEGAGGPARNLHKLDLAGTHYEDEDDYGDSLW